MDYSANFLVVTAMISHIWLWHGKDLIAQIKAAFQQIDSPEQNDIHSKLMSEYRDVPEWFYILFLLICMTLLCVVTQTTNFHMPIWATFLGVFLTMILVIPIGIVLVDLSRWFI